ncbi:MAG TPA: pitrilysin family protein [Bryobacteraceae bacterium]|nr:pitrilysin family protein [Bryobacteraceae bacterium]
MNKILPLLMSVLTLSAAGTKPTQPQMVALPSKEPLVSVRIVFLTGSADDPAGKEGLAALTAAMLSEGGSKNRTYKQIVDTFYPMASGLNSYVDKEMTTFTGTTHVDNLEKWYAVIREMLLEPGWRADDLTRLRDHQINFLRTSLRGNNDEELGKEVLYNRIYEGHPYGHHNSGTVSALNSITLTDLQEFYKKKYTRGRVIIGIGGGYPDSFRAQIEKDFARLGAGGPAERKLAQPKAPDGIRVTMIEKPTRSIAYSFGFPIDVKRGHPDYPALLVAQSYLGQHRNSGGQLYNRIREARGINYGDYAYIEYFPRGMFQFEPDPNLARSQQIFQVWIRPVEPPTAQFTLRLAFWEMQKFVNEGLSEEAFQRSRSFLSKYVNLLMKTKTAELGYTIDSRFYDIPEYATYLKTALAKLTREDVNKAIKRHLRADRLDLVIVGQGMEAFKQELVSNKPSPMTYNSPKPEQILEEDKKVQALNLGLKPESMTVIPVEKVFE